MAEWEELSCLERAILCNLWRMAPKAGKKPANIPLQVLMRGLDPALRDSSLINRAVKELEKRGLAEWYAKRKQRTLTITLKGKQLAQEHCPEEWEAVRVGDC